MIQMVRVGLRFGHNLIHTERLLDEQPGANILEKFGKMST